VLGIWPNGKRFKPKPWKLTPEEAPQVVGDWCQFCKASRRAAKAQLENAQETAKAEFTEDAGIFKRLTS
jgi:hypothetical protein